MIACYSHVSEHLPLMTYVRRFNTSYTEYKYSYKQQCGYMNKNRCIGNYSGDMCVTS